MCPEGVVSTVGLRSRRARGSTDSRRRRIHWPIASGANPAVHRRRRRPFPSVRRCRDVDELTSLTSASASSTAIRSFILAVHQRRVVRSGIGQPRRRHHRYAANDFEQVEARATGGPAGQDVVLIEADDETTLAAVDEVAEDGVEDRRRRAGRQRTVVKSKSLCCTIFMRNYIGLLIGIASCEDQSPDVTETRLYRPVRRSVANQRNN